MVYVVLKAFESLDIYNIAIIYGAITYTKALKGYTIASTYNQSLKL